MKIKNTITLALAASLLIAAGCASDQRRAEYTDTSSLPVAYQADLQTTDRAIFGAGQSSLSSPRYSPTAPVASSTVEIGSLPATSSPASESLSTANGTDTVLVGQIRHSLEGDAELVMIVPAVQISVSSGAVTLTGIVASEQQKRQVETVVQRQTGVTSVNNQLQVSSRSSAEAGGLDQGMSSISPSSSAQGSESSGSLIQTPAGLESGALSAGTPAEKSGAEAETSAAIADTAGASMTAGVSASGMESAGANEMASPTSERAAPASSTLDGESKSSTPDASPADSSAAGTAAAAGASVESTQSQSGSATGAGSSSGAVTVDIQGASDSDKSLVQQIDKQVRADTTLAPVLSQIKIQVNGGKVTLQGSVRTQEEKRQIETSVQRALGVTSVDDQILVGTPTESR